MKKELKKTILCAIFTALAFVTSSIVVFPNMAPFQHMYNVLLAVLLGPEYAFASAFLAGGLRMIYAGRSITAIIGGVVGALLSGLLYRFTRKLSLAWLGEVIGTGVLSAILAFFVMNGFYAKGLEGFYYYIPFFLPSTLVGASLGVFLLDRLKKSHVLPQAFTLNPERKKSGL